MDMLFPLIFPTTQQACLLSNKLKNGSRGGRMALSCNQIMVNIARLHEAWGDMIPPCDSKLRHVADKAVKGIVEFECNGLTPTQVGRKGINWYAPQHKNQEWPAQLNRFFFLGHWQRPTGKRKARNMPKRHVTTSGIGLTRTHRGMTGKSRLMTMF